MSLKQIIENGLAIIVTSFICTLLFYVGLFGILLSVLSFVFWDIKVFDTGIDIMLSMIGVRIFILIWIIIAYGITCDCIKNNDFPF